MKEFALKHPYLTTLLLVPVAVGGAVRLTYALLGRKTPFEQVADSLKKLATPSAPWTAADQAKVDAIPMRTLNKDGTIT